MGRLSGSKTLILTLLLAGLASAAAPPQVVDDIKSLLAHGDMKGALAAADAALAHVGAGEVELAARLNILRAKALLSNPKMARQAALPPLPKSLRDSDAAVDRLRVLAITSYQLHLPAKEATASLDAAYALAVAKHPEMVGSLLLAKLNIEPTPAGKMKTAREGMAFARRMHDAQLEARMQANMSRLLALSERFDEAVDVGEPVYRFAEENHNDVLKQAVAGNLGWCYKELGDVDAAETYMRTALQLATRAGATTDLVVWHQQLGDLALQREDLAGAEREYNTALALAQQVGDAKQLGFAYANLARVAIERHDWAAAREMNAKAIEMKKKSVDDADGVPRSRILDARIDLNTGRLDAARATLDAVLAATAQKSIRWEAETELAHVFVAGGDDAAAEKHFQAALQILGSSRESVHTEERRLSFGHVAVDLLDDYVDFLARQRGRERDALRVAELSRARTLAEGLKSDAKARDLLPEQLARAAKATVLSYWLAPARALLFVVTPGGVQMFVLPPAKEIGAAVAAYQHDLLGMLNSIESSGDRGAQLFDLLVPPAAAAAIRGKRVAVIPDGPLATLNFETLVIRAPQPHYWIEDVTIETASAMQFLAGTRGTNAGSRMLLVGDAPAADPAYPPLPHAAEEIALVARHFEHPTRLTGANATPGKVLAKAAEPYAFIHFVAHGVATRQRPLDSAVILGADKDGYKLYARNIIKHPLNARLVTISSCHGAGRRALEGEGLVGLAWAFLRAGAHEVIAALWEVDDAATPALMDDMYAGIRDHHLAPADALRAAKLKLLHSESSKRKPRYWAPFVLYSGS
jgi:tetratricopeptide (TPR) repeat protein